MLVAALAEGSILPIDLSDIGLDDVAAVTIVPVGGAVGAPLWGLRMKSLSWLALVVLSVTLPACATMPVEHEVDRSRVYTENRDVVWERAVNFFAEKNLNIRTIDKSSGLIAADRQIKLPVTGFEGLADCGDDPLKRRFLQTVDLNLFVRTLPNGSTSVTVNTRFTEQRMLGYNLLTLSTISCVSTGKLEQGVLAALNEKI